ncbi:MAG TPA: cytochrome c [Candidatus Aquilonibacter sp.]
MFTRPFLLFFACLLGLCGTGCAHRTSVSGRTDDRRGAALYAKNCSVCHSAGSARIGPPLDHEGRRMTLAQIVRTIDEPDPPMPKLFPSVLSDRDVQDIAAYVKTL